MADNAGSKTPKDLPKGGGRRRSNSKSEAKAEETKAEETKVEETKVEEPKVEEPKAEETKVEETKVEEPKAEDKKPPIGEPQSKILEALEADKPKEVDPATETKAGKMAKSQEELKNKSETPSEQKPAQSEPPAEKESPKPVASKISATAMDGEVTYENALQLQEDYPELWEAVSSASNQHPNLRVVGMDPLMIASLVIALIRLFMDCRTKTQIRRLVKRAQGADTSTRAKVHGRLMEYLADVNTTPQTRELLASQLMIVGAQTHDNVWSQAVGRVE